MFEIGRVLAARGHTVEFATLEGQGSWAKGYGFIKKIYLLGPGPTEEQLNAHHRQMRAQTLSSRIKRTMESKYLFDSFWPQTYQGLKVIMDDPASRPDIIIANFLVDAAKDINLEYDIPIATVWPHIPPRIPCSHVLGDPGLKLANLAPENASMWLCIKNGLDIILNLPTILRWMGWTRQMRHRAGVDYIGHWIQKPDSLILVNAFVGLEILRELQPNCAVAGPLLSDSYPSLDAGHEKFLSQHKSIIYIALGTNVILSNSDTVKIINALLDLMEEQWIDGVIWAANESSRQEMDPQEAFQRKKGQDTITHRLADLLDGDDLDWMFPLFAPQRAILDHSSTKVYFTHGSTTSINEGLFHGKPMLSMGHFADQIQNSSRLVAAGVAESLDKPHFTSDEVYMKAKKILQDEGGAYHRNALRLMRIAHVASRRKLHAADMVEEVLYDTELRYKDKAEPRLMHRQKAGILTPAYQAGKWDMGGACALGLAAVMGSAVLTGQFLWNHRGYFTNPAQLLLTGHEWLRRTLRK